jgi:UDP-glucose 4-epimerase
MNSIFLAGGAGYIGSHVAMKLVDFGYKVFVFDNFSRSSQANLLKGVGYIEGELSNSAELEQLFVDLQIDLVMHFAAFAYVDESVRSPIDYYRNNVGCTVSLLNAMIKRNIKKIIFSSSCAVYGNGTSEPFTEEAITNPINPYGRTKLMVENILADCWIAYSLSSISLRYFNAAGADRLLRCGESHDPETHIIPKILEEALRVKDGGDPSKTKLKIYGGNLQTKDGSCVRDFVHVEDIATAHLKAAHKLFSSGANGSEIFNLSNGSGYSVQEVIESCRRITGQPIYYEVDNPRLGDPQILIGNSDKAQRLLDWSCEIPELDDIVDSAWKWLLKNKQPNIGG